MYYGLTCSYVILNTIRVKQFYDFGLQAHYLKSNQQQSQVHDVTFSPLPQILFLFIQWTLVESGYYLRGSSAILRDQSAVRYEDNMK